MTLLWLGPHHWVQLNWSKLCKPRRKTRGHAGRLILQEGGGELAWVCINIPGMAVYFPAFSSRDWEFKSAKPVRTSSIPPWFSLLPCMLWFCFDNQAYLLQPRTKNKINKKNVCPTEGAGLDCEMSSEHSGHKNNEHSRSFLEQEFKRSWYWLTDWLPPKASAPFYLKY